VTKYGSLNRLRDISKQRSIRRPLLVQPDLRLVEDDEPKDNQPKPRDEEWPIGS